MNSGSRGSHHGLNLHVYIGGKCISRRNFTVRGNIYFTVNNSHVKKLIILTNHLLITNCYKVLPSRRITKRTRDTNLLPFLKKLPWVIFFIQADFHLNIFLWQKANEKYRGTEQKILRTNHIYFTIQFFLNMLLPGPT